MTQKFDKIVFNGRIYSIEREGEFYDAMAIRENRIVKLFDAEPSDSDFIAKDIIDLNGKTVVPGLTDGHFHFMITAALSEMALNVSEIIKGRIRPDCLEEFKEKLRKFAETRDPKKPIFCYNYVIAAMNEDRLPFHDEIDRWVPDRMVFILSMDGHSSSYSSRALRMLGFDPQKSNGILSGEEHEFNVGKLNEIIMKYLDLKTLVKGFQNTINLAIENGIVGIHCLDGFDDSKNDPSLLFLSKFGGISPLYMRLFPQLRDANRVLPYTKAMTYPRIGGCGGWEMDGSVASRTAAFTESYKDDPDNFGRLLFPQNELNSAVQKAHDIGFQITSHAIGTRGIEAILTSYKTLFHEKELKSNFRRHRIDHFEFPTHDQVDSAINEIGLLITAQPGYAWIDELYQKSYRKYLTTEQFNRQIPLKTIMDMGGYLIGSSDSPVQMFNPFIQISGMVNFPIVNERLSIFQALRTYTYNVAYSTFEESIRGTLSLEKNADFIVLSKDPFKISKDQIAELKVLETYIKGKKQKKMKSSTMSFFIRGFLPNKSRI